MRQFDVWIVFLSEKWNISNPVNKSQVDATAVVRQELFDPCVIKWIIKYVSHKKLYLAVTLVSKFHPHAIRKWTYKVAKFTEMFATISLGSCLIINLVYEVLCPNPVQGLSNAPFTRQISILREETKLKFILQMSKCSNPPCLRCSKSLDKHCLFHL